MEAVSVLLKPRWVALHVFAAVVVAGCTWAAWWQFTVAQDGSGRSLGYALQWPAIGIFGLGVWAWLCRDGIRAAREGDSAKPPPPAPAPVRRTPVVTVDPDEDPELAAYNAMLARLHEKDENA
ncbi:hypothetical protein GCM10009547_22330 [Sporichthya brevicatena]|uniref:DNA-binding transcriptional regulator of glucitol operon n=1 Tax=Sporichthya brevicatena TaxID=171442 RepID=A0ABN1GTV2_9ACTN